MEKLSIHEFYRLRKLIHRNARALDFTMWNYLFENGSCGEFLTVLSSYQNEDGGFGHNIECNNWNPNSSPYTVCIALDYLDAVNEDSSCVKQSIVKGIIKYLESGEYELSEGWTGMQVIPSNNDYAHLPWLHFESEKANQVDIGVTKILSDFILKYADEHSELFCKAQKFKENLKDNGIVMIGGVPDLNPSILDLKSYTPETWPFWIPSPICFVKSPKNPLYPELKDVIDLNLDAIVKKLKETNEVIFATESELQDFEKNNQRPDVKKWCLPEQTVGNYYWGSHHIVTDLYLLKKFGRLDFDQSAFIK